MSTRISVAESAEEREAIFRLRYQIYVKELGIYGHKADHERQILRDEFDEGARLLYASVDGRAVGSLRIHIGTDGALPEPYRRTYDTARFEDLIPETRMGVMTRFMLAPEQRGSTLTFRLILRCFQEQIDAGVLVSFCDCEPHLVSLYNSLGLRAYAPGYNSQDQDLLIPLAMLFADRQHLESIKSPVLSSLRLPAMEPEPLRALRQRVQERAAARPAEVNSHAALWAMLHGALTGSDPKGFPLLGGLSAEETRLVLKYGQVIDCKQGDTIVHRGQISRTIFVVLNGQVVVRDGPRELTRMGPGDAFGEIAFLLGGRRIADVVAASEQVRVLGLSERTMRSLLENEESSRVAARLLLNLSRDLALKLALQTSRREEAPEATL
jgi:hypothetical protein